MINNTCNQCGAPINTKTKTCDYCSTSYEQPFGIDIKFSKKSGIMALSDTQIIKMLQKRNSSVLEILPVLIFMIIWTSIPTIGMIFILAQGDLSGLIIVIFPIIGISVMIGFLVPHFKGNIKKVTRTCKSGNFEKALAISDKKQDKNINYNIAYIIISAYHFKQLDEKVHQKLMLLPFASLKQLKNSMPAINEIATLYEM